MTQHIYTSLPKGVVSTALEYSSANLERNRKFGLVTKSGVVYDEELAGPGGMSYVLLRESHTTNDMLAAAALQLRGDRDVVGSIKVTGAIASEVVNQAPEKPLQLVAIVVGAVSNGFSISQVVDEHAAPAAVREHLAAGQFAEAVAIHAPKNRNHPLQPDSAFVAFSTGFGSGLELFGPFPEDRQDAEEFGEEHREDGSEWEIWTVRTETNEVARPRG